MFWVANITPCMSWKGGFACLTLWLSGTKSLHKSTHTSSAVSTVLAKEPFLVCSGSSYLARANNKQLPYKDMSDYWGPHNCQGGGKCVVWLCLPSSLLERAWQAKVMIRCMVTRVMFHWIQLPRYMCIGSGDICLLPIYFLLSVQHMCCLWRSKYTIRERNGTELRSLVLLLLLFCLILRYGTRDLCNLYCVLKNIPLSS